MNKNDGIVYLRSAEVRDVKVLSSWWSDGEVMAHAGFPKGLKTDLDKLKLRIEQSLKEELPKNQLLIFSIKNDYRIGEMSYRETDKDIYEIGIKICEINEQGKGYGERVMTLLINFIKDDLKGKKIVLDTNVSNKGSQRFYKRLGFKELGTRVDCWTDQLGKLQSAVDFEMKL